MGFVFRIETNVREGFIDITSDIANAVKKEGWSDGAVHIFCSHTTCGLTINESADPDVRTDLLTFFDSIAPRSGQWKHSEGNSDAHIRSSLLGVSLLIPLIGSRLALGRWQAIYLYEGDGPRQRSLWVQRLQA